MTSEAYKNGYYIIANIVTVTVNYSIVAPPNHYLLLINYSAMNIIINNAWYVLCFHWIIPSFLTQFLISILTFLMNGIDILSMY